MRLRLMVGTLALALTAGVSPALAVVPPDAPPESYLYIVDAANVRVKPSKDGTRAKIVLDDVTVTRFSDRPYRHEHYLTVREMFRDVAKLDLRWRERPAQVTVAEWRADLCGVERMGRAMPGAFEDYAACRGPSATPATNAPAAPAARPPRDPGR